MSTLTLPKKEIVWGAALIRQLRAGRTQAEFGALLGVPKNTVWRWEAGQARPDPVNAEGLSRLAARERFLADWKVGGSLTLLKPLGDLEEASRRIHAQMIRQAARSARQLG
jgi:transcriptional regulator with XRE-family HTH domain